MKFKKLLGALAVSSVLASGSALAAPFTINVNAFDPTPLGGTNGITSPMVQLGVNFQATSIFTDTDNNGVDLGDSVVDTGFGSVNGYLAAGAQALVGGEANEGLGVSHSMRFTYNNLAGLVSFVNGGNILTKYTSGTINVFSDTNADGDTIDVGEKLLMTLDVFDSFGEVGNVILLAKISFVEMGIFFFNGVSDFANSTIEINTRIDSNIDAIVPMRIGDSNQFTRTSTLDGSINFEVPEPGMLALVGLGLVGIGFARRNKKQA
jgi:hypothetical protein